jgi:hypothetical protein
LRDKSHRPPDVPGSAKKTVRVNVTARAPSLMRALDGNEESDHKFQQFILRRLGGIGAS